MEMDSEDISDMWKGMSLKDSCRIVGKQPPTNETAKAKMVRRQISYEGRYTDSKHTDGSESGQDEADGPIHTDIHAESKRSESESLLPVTDTIKEIESNGKDFVDITEQEKVENTELKIRKKWPPNFRYKDIFFAFLALLTFGIDYGTDVALMVEYYMDNEITLFAVTFAFIAAPSIISGIISAVWHRALYLEKMKSKTFQVDEQESKEKKEYKEKHRKRSRFLFIAMTVLSFVQLGRIAR